MLHAIFLLSLIGLGRAALLVEHSFDGSTFSPAGKLLGNVLVDDELSWERPDLTDDEQELFEQAATTDGLYFVRVQTSRGPLLTSVPASLLRTPDTHEQAELHATRDGAVVAFNYVPTQRGKAAADDHAAAAGDAARPKRLAVRVVMPKPGPMLHVPEAAGEFMDIAVDSVDGAAVGGMTLDPSAKPRAAAGGGPGARKGAPPPPDERSWLQKNWLFVLAGGMMVLNVVAKAAAPPPGQGGQAGPAAGATGGARRS